MPEPPPFVVRLLPSTGLEGAFRVHLAPEALETLGLRVGDICKITGENGSLGFGIAWRATDKMGNSPKLRPAKMTDSLRSAFGFKEGSHVTITKTSAKIVLADNITLTDVTPSDYGNVSEVDDGRWLTRCAYLFSNCEAIANGVTFDVTAKKVKKRYCVDQVASAAAPSGTPALYLCTDKTHVAFAGEKPLPVISQSSTSNGHVLSSLDTSRIGGLVDQVRLLNRRLQNLLRQSSNPVRGPDNRSRNSHILIHGYEGTGKSLLLKQLEYTNACRMFKLNHTTLAAVPASKSVATIQGVFNDALINQPSIVLMDRIEKLAPSDNDLHAGVLEAEFEKLEGSNVLVVATTRAVSSLDNILVGPGRLSKLIELPIPDIATRKQILNVLLNSSPNSDDFLTTTISQKTHAFTGRDLAFLVDRAQDNAFERYYDEHENSTTIDNHATTTNGASPTESVTPSNDTTVVEATEPTPESDVVTPSLADFEVALTEVGPTALREVILEKPTVQWSDIGGSDSIKQRFDETLGWPLHYPHILARHHAKPQRGVLLYGPPGCSKTLTAQAVATTYDLNFLAVKGAELISMYVGESERAVREVFRKARQAAPCVIFFDEIDSIGSERDNGGTKGLNVLTTLLNEMDGFEASNGVLVLAATNKPDVLDSALMRPGRFDSHVYLGPPNTVARQGIFEISLRGLPVGDDVDLADLVEKTEGYSGAEIVRICEMAKLGAMRREIAAEAGGGAGNDGLVLSGEAEGKYRRADFEDAINGVKRGITNEMLMAYEAFARRDE